MKLKVNINRDDYADFAKFHFMKAGLKNNIIFYSLTLVIFLIAINLNNFGWLKTILFLISYSAIIFFITIRWLNKSKKIPQDNGSFLGEIEYEFLEDGFTHKKYNSEGKVNWSIIKSFEEGKNAFYLYIDSIVAFVITKRSFANNEELNNFRTIVERKIQK